jgi:hypothetical protein
VFPASELCGL